MMNRMRALDFTTFLQRALMAVFTVALLIVAACSEDEPVAPVTVEFNTPTSRSVDESFGDDVVINVKLSGAAKKAGTLAVSATSTVGSANDHVTFDDEIAIDKGNTAAQFVVNLKDNQAIDGAKTITFTLADPTSGFELGTAKTYTLVINDDEGPTTANFAVGSASIGEGSTTGVVVTINLTPAATTAGTVQITIDPTTAPVTTTPAATAGVVTVTVPDNATTVSFTVIPTDNETPNESVEVGFEITGSSGGVQIGALKDYALTIEDDDAVEPTAISEVRAMYSGTGTQDIDTPLLIQGIITSINPQTNNNNIWVQDATGGIVVRFSGANTNFYKRGDEVIVNLEGANFASFSGLVQVENVTKADAATASDKVEVVSENNTLPEAEVVTFTQLKTNSYQGKLVSVENVSFVDADGILTMNGTRAISDGTETVNVRTESAAPFSGSLMPLGSGTVTGLASINGGTVQIIPMVFAEDVFENSPVGTIGVTQELVDFGSVDNGDESTVQSYTVQGTTLDSDIVISASTGFKVSLTEGGAYESSVTILAAEANIANTVYVKFIPVSGANQEIEGAITHKSQGAASVSFDVTGTEQGNVAGTGTLMIYEVYGGGGNSGATYKNDYVVLYNGTANPIDLSAYTLQYGSATSASGTFGPSNIAPLAGTIDAGKFLLIKLAAGTGGTTDLPTPNYAATPALALGGGGGKIALVLGSDPASVVAPMSSTVADFVGFGNANFFEGTAATPAPSNSTSVKRKTFVDTNDNGVDFAAGPIDLSYLN